MASTRGGKSENASPLDDRWERIARAIANFTENPFTLLVKGILLVTIGVVDASESLLDDMAHGQLRVGHGMIVIGLFSMLESFPHFVEGLEAGKRFIEKRHGKTRGESDTNAGPDVDDERLS